MKILLVHNHYQQHGGEDTAFAREKALLESYGHELLSYEQDNDAIAAYSALQKAALPLRSIWSQGDYQRLRALLRREQPAVMHVHNTFPLISPAVYYAAAGLHVPVVQRLPNFRLLCPVATFFRDGHICEDCLGKTPPLPAIQHGCYRDSRAQTAVVAAMLSAHRWLKTWQRRVNIFVPTAEFVRQKFIAAGFAPEKLIAKPNFVYPDPQPRAPAQAPGDYALYVGRLSPEKGLWTLLEAWQQLPDIPLKIVGAGPLEGALQERVQAAGLQQVELLGRRPPADIFPLMKGARFLVFPSECYETFGFAIVEAFACAVPVLAAAISTPAELVTAGQNGLHYPPGDAASLAAQARWLWAHPAEAIQMGQAARASYEAQYNAASNHRQLMAIYAAAGVAGPSS